MKSTTGHFIRLLLVDDDEDDYLLLKDIISEIKSSVYKLDWASSYEEGLKATLCEQYDVCLVDYRLGAQSGVELISEARKSSDYPPVMILLSGEGDMDVDQAAMAAGATDYLVKGETNATLLERTIRYALERKRIEEPLSRLASIVQNSADAIIGKNIDGTITSWNAGAEQIYGYSAEEIVGRSIYTIVPEERYNELQHILESIRRGEKVQLSHTERIRKDGTRIDVSVTISPIKDAHGRVTGASTIAREVTQQRRAEEAREKIARQLATTAQAYQRVMDNSLDVICMIDGEGRFIQVSKACESVWGYTPEEILGHSYIALVHPEDREKTDQAAAEIMSGVATRDFENRYLRKDGSEVCMMWSAIWSEEDKTMFCVARDVTELKRSEDVLRKTEEQLRQSQKMEAIGQLAGGIAHDFNNLLTAITGYTELSMRKLYEGDPLLANLKEIRSAASRAASLTRQLLAFSRRQILQPKVLDLNKVISEMEKMLRRLIGEDIELRTVLGASPGSVKVDPGQIEQVVMNLALNARDAMPEGGNLIIETQNIFLDPNFAGQHIGVVAGPYILLAVSDTGRGMSEETKVRIFEPFFTTKERGKGTGLGLSTVYGIVKQSGGSIWVYSEVGEGTTVKIYLPQVDEGASAYVRHSAPAEVPGGAETILLAEDEELVRNLARVVLEESGYKVLEAPRGGEALLLSEQYTGTIHLLLTDVVMPEMSGRQLAERLDKARPGIKVLYMSGYTADAVVRRGLTEDAANFIQKPFTPDALAIKVREALDRD